MITRTRADIAWPHTVAISTAVLVVLGLSVTSVNDVTWEQRALVFVMFAASTVSYANWRARRVYGLPVFAMISLVYVVFFALALFWVKPVSPSFFDQGGDLPKGAITDAMRMAALGLASMWLGMRTGLPRRLCGRLQLPDIRDSQLRSPWIRALVTLGAAGSFAVQMPTSFGGLQNVFIVAVEFVPLVAFAILLDLSLAGKSSTVDRALLIIFVVCRLTAGLSSGVLTSVVSLGFVAVAFFLRAGKTMPWPAIVTTLCIILFLQPGKAGYRQRYSWQSDEASAVERGSFWISRSSELWGAFLRTGHTEVFGDLASATVQRASLLTQAALVCEKTPDVVPFQRGITYQYMVVTLIPRLFWPDKPSVNDANRLYQVAYGLTKEDELNSVSIAVGVLPEAFMNFGWFGVTAVMFLMGIFYDAYQHLLLSAHAGRFAGAIALALITQLLMIEGQMAQYLGGIVQQLLLTWVLFRPLLRFRVKASLRTCASA